MNNRNKFVVVLGPTAVGKTDLSIELAKKFKGEIVSCDSMQIYRGMNIGTAKIKNDEKKGIKHHLIDIVDPDEEFTVADYSVRAKKKIDSINSLGKLPIFVGGTGLYINSLIYDLNFTEVEADDKIRERYENMALDKGNNYIHNILEKIDPKSASRLHPNDTRRVIRAIEIYEITGEKMSERNQNFRRPNLEDDFYLLGLNMDRKDLYDRINRRVDLMIQEGLIEEVRSLMAKGYDRELVSMQAIGYKEIIEYLEGNISLDEAIILLKRNSRRYAKRQLTWFRKEKDVNWIDVDSYDKDLVFNNIDKMLISN